MILKDSKIKNLDFRKKNDLEKKYILIVANGDMIITDKGNDTIIGNAIFDKVKIK